MWKRQDERGIALIIAVAVTVAAVMIVVALLAMVTRSGSSARSIKRADVMRLALDTARAKTFYALTTGNFLTSVDPAAPAIPVVKMVDPADPAAFSAAYREINRYDGFDNLVDDIDFASLNSGDAADTKYQVKYRAFAIPLSGAFNIDLVKRGDYQWEFDGGKPVFGKYPFPGLFDGKNALAKLLANSAIEGLFETARFPNNEDGDAPATVAEGIKNVVSRNGTPAKISQIPLLLVGVNPDGTYTGYGALKDNLFGDGADSSGNNKWDHASDQYQQMVEFARRVQAAADNSRSRLTIYDHARIVVNYAYYKPDKSSPTPCAYADSNAGSRLRLAELASGMLADSGATKTDGVFDGSKWTNGKISSFVNYCDDGANSLGLGSAAENALKRRAAFESFMTLGVSFSILNRAQPSATVLTPQVFTASLPYSLPQYAGKNASRYDDGGTWADAGRPTQIPLGSGTSESLIESAVNWQLNDSPSAQVRLAAGTQDANAIYRIDYTIDKNAAQPAAAHQPDEDLTYVFDHRRFLNNYTANVGDSDKGELFHAPPKEFTTDGNTVYADYYAYPLQYAMNINPTDCLLSYAGWNKSTELDLLRFAEIGSGGSREISTAGYEVNGESPFRLGDSTDNLNRFIDRRTGTFAGTGTRVTPVIGPVSVIIGSRNDLARNGRLGAYSNSLRVHGELAEIVHLINLHKGNEHAIPQIVREIYASPKIGYRAGVAVSRPLLTTDGDERQANIIWANVGSDAVPAFAPVIGDKTTETTWDAHLNKKSNWGDQKISRYSGYTSPIVSAGGGGGATGDSYNSNDNASYWSRAANSRRGPITPKAANASSLLESIETAGAGNLVYCDGDTMGGVRTYAEISVRGGNARVISAPPYRRSTGRWFMQGNTPAANSNGEKYMNRQAVKQKLGLEVSGSAEGSEGSTAGDGVAISLGELSFNDANIQRFNITGDKTSGSVPYYISYANLQNSSFTGDPAKVGTLFRDPDSVMRFVSGAGTASNPWIESSLTAGTLRQRLTSKWRWWWGKWLGGTGAAAKWIPAVGATYPMYVEINPQAIKNAAIERVVINLFGREVIDPNTGSNLIKNDYLGDLKEYDYKYPIFGTGDGETYRILLIAGLIDNDSDHAKKRVVATNALHLIVRNLKIGKMPEVLETHYLNVE